MKKEVRSDIQKIRTLRFIIEENQKKIDAFIECGIQDERIADLFADITVARNEINDIRNERIQAIYKKGKK